MKKFDIWLLISLILCAAVAVVFAIPGVIPYSDETLGKLMRETIPRLAVGALLILLMIKGGYAGLLKAKWKGKHLLWSIPCFLVALVNFPVSALIGGEAVIERADLLWLLLLNCGAIALVEEAFFRGILLPFFMERMKHKRYRVLFAVLSTAALFALMHLINLFFGAGLLDTALQVGYTFLLGCMLAVMLLKTKNIWLCMIVHFVFDIGGTIVTALGRGEFQDTVFWILTAVVGAACAVHIVFACIKMIKADSPANDKTR